MPADLRRLLQILVTPPHRSLRRGNALDYKLRDLCLSPGSATVSPDLPKPVSSTERLEEMRFKLLNNFTFIINNTYYH